MKKRIVLCLMVAVLLSTLFVFPQKAKAASGFVSHTINWYFDSSTGTLTFKGTGRVDDVPNETMRTWKDVMPKVKTIEISQGITYIGCFAFYGGENVTSVKLPSSLTYIADHAFEGCGKLESIVFPNGITGLGNNAFYGCTNLKTIDFPNTLSRIGEYAFANCDELTSLEIPDTVLTIGKGAFKNCESLTSISFYEAGMTDRVAQQIQWRKIDEEAFAECQNLTNIQLSRWINYIGNDAFRRCVMLCDIVVPEGVTYLGACFTECWKLSEVSLPNSLHTLFGTFRYCPALEHIDLPQNLEYIEEAFRGSENLTKIVLPDSLKTVGGSTFEGCKGLAEVVLPSQLERIGFRAFYGCSSLQYITLPETICEIDNEVFSCSGLVELTIPSSLRTLGKTRHPYDVIKPGVFSGCDKLQAVFFLGKVPSFEKDAFRNDGKLLIVYYPAGDKSWEKAIEDHKWPSPSYIDDAYCVPRCYDGHTFGEWEELEAPTEQGEGVAQRICTGCKLKENKPIDKLQLQPTEPMGGMQLGGDPTGLIIGICAAVLAGGGIVAILVLKRKK